MDGGAWWAAVHGVARSQTRLSDFTFTFPFHALEKEMATRSSVLAWRIPGMGEPGGLAKQYSRQTLVFLGGRCSRISGWTPEARSRICVCRASFLKIGRALCRE